MKGRGLFRGRKAKGDRIGHLQQQIETWRGLLSQFQ